MKLSPAKQAAYCAVACALLIAVQLAFSAVSGVELVTVLLLSFCTYFGVACGVLTAVSFSLLRCIIFGFYPAVVVLYLIYYPLFALCFALVGRAQINKVAELILSNALLIILGALSGCAAGFKLIKISVVYAGTVNALLWAVCGVCLTLIIALNAIYVAVKRKKADEKFIKLFMLCALACTFTAAFTFLDDIITPLFLGMERETALAYFYASFIALLPQLICTAVSVPALYFPLIYAYTKACPKAKWFDKRR